jgi:hypothetical protein
VSKLVTNIAVMLDLAIFGHERITRTFPTPYSLLCFATSFVDIPHNTANNALTGRGLKGLHLRNELLL